MRSNLAIAVLLAVILFAANASAATLSDYAGRVRLARAAADDLKAFSASGPVSRDAQVRLFGIIESSLPRTEQLDVSGTTIKTDYVWLYDAMRLFESSTDGDQRREIAAMMAARLRAIEHSVNELVKAEAAGPTKDADKGALEKILQRPDYKPVEPQRSPLTRLFERLIDWLFRRYPRPDIVPAASDGMPNLASALQILLFLAIAVGLGFIAYKLAPHFLPKLRKSNSRKRERVILGEVIDDDTTTHELFSEAEALARSGQLTLAIRKAYIAALCGLEERRLLILAKHKTNRDYLFDLRKRDEIVSEMNAITREFESHWYGAKESTAEDWERVSALYRQTISRAERA
ncbi:MAG: hypothetical protein UZ17_ACD001001889 [Acidobacteria bacterium OLB17]|nr:MAG: hypothetical protein UZ17_ACD001001889 [Acidobacteria bacterium OLB17]MCZ2390226.1 DUF4129 domain-containing protein [Acidobacteriota bacterium]